MSERRWNTAGECPVPRWMRFVFVFLLVLSVLVLVENLARSSVFVYLAIGVSLLLAWLRVGGSR